MIRIQAAYCSTWSDCRCPIARNPRKSHPRALCCLVSFSYLFFFFLRFLAFFFLNEVDEGKGKREETGGCAGERGCSGKRKKQHASSSSPLLRAWDELWHWLWAWVWVGGRQGLEMRAGAECPLLAPLDCCIWSGEGGDIHSNAPGHGHRSACSFSFCLRVLDSWGAHTVREPAGFGTVRLGMAVSPRWLNKNLVGGRLAS